MADEDEIKELAVKILSHVDSLQFFYTSGTAQLNVKYPEAIKDTERLLKLLQGQERGQQ